MPISTILFAKVLTFVSHLIYISSVCKVVAFLGGTLPGYTLLHLKQFSIFGMITRLPSLLFSPNMDSRFSRFLNPQLSLGSSKLETCVFSTSFPIPSLSYKIHWRRSYSINLSSQQLSTIGRWNFVQKPQAWNPLHTSNQSTCLTHAYTQYGHPVVPILLSATRPV